MSATRYNEYEKGFINSNIWRRLNRLQHTVPFPLPGTPMQQYASLLDEELLEHLRAISQHPQGKAFVHTDTAASIRTGPSGRAITFRFDAPFLKAKWSQELPYITMRENHPQKQEILHWVEEAEAVIARIRRAEAFANTVVGFCNTPGQVKRVFPAMVKLMPTKFQATIENYKRVSQYPDGWRETDEIREVRAASTETFHLAALLPESLDGTTPKVWI